MKIAILHDYFDEIGGAEIIALRIAQEIGATIYTTNIDIEKIRKAGFDETRLKSIGKVPKKIPLKQYTTRLRFNNINIKKHDMYIFNGPYSIQASKKLKPNMWYVNSYLKKLYNKDGKGILKSLWRHLDKKSANSIGRIISNSEETKKNVKRIYGRPSKVVRCPALNYRKLKYRESKGHWISVNRIDPYKRIEIQLKAFSKIPQEKLLIIGNSSKNNKAYFEKLKKVAPKNIVFKELYSEKKINDLYARCKGTICTAKDEDFGMSPVESMASGKPVIASNEGGHKETIIHGKTGELIDNIDGEKLADAIKRWSKKLSKKENRELFRKNCQKRAKKFDTDKFIEKIKREIKKEGRKWGRDTEIKERQ